MSDLGDFDPDPDREEPTRSEPADFGGGESTGVQDLLGEDEPDTDTDESDMPTEPQRLEETMQETETTHNLNESADKIRLKTQLTRGTGTRDQEKIEVKIRGDDPTEAVEKLNKTLELLNETAEIARGTQAGDDE